MTAADMRHLQRWGQVFMALLALLIFVAGLLMARNVWRDVRRPPPFTYSQDVYLPLAPVCAGQTLQWRSEFTLNRGKFNTIHIARVLFDVQRGVILKPDDQLEYYVWTETEWGKPQAGVISFPLPDDLPPGQYEVRVSAAASSTEDTGYRVPFVIPESCLKGAT